MYKDIEKLKNIASSIAVLNQKINNIHFNYQGIDFYSVHKLTEKLYEKMLDQYDLFSEKINQLGDKAPGSFKEHLERTFIKEVSQNVFKLKDVIDMIVQDLKLLEDMTKKIETHITIDPLRDELYLLTDKYAWLFNSFITKNTN